MNPSEITSSLKMLKEYGLSNLKNHYIHPLGFYFYLLEQSKEYDIRLHIWSNEIKHRVPKNPNFPIHDHIFGFDSYILCGELTNITYLYNEKPDGNYEKYNVSYENDKNSSLLTKDSKKYEIIKVTEYAYRKGDSYSLDSQVVHQVIPSLEFTATLVKTKNKIDTAPVVFGEAIGLDRYKIERSNMQNDEIANLHLEKLFEVIGL